MPIDDPATSTPPARSVPVDLDRLRSLLRDLGAGDAELDEALAGGTAGALALELVFRTAPPLTLGAAAARSALSTEDFLAFWQVLGLPAPAPGRADVPAELADALPIVTQATQEWLGEASAMGLTRVIGTATARLAEAVVDAFRVGVELPELSAGTDYTDVVAGFVELTRGGFPGLEALLGAALRTHVVRVAAGTWAPDEQQQATRRDLFVGFVDLVGYTALARTLSAGELAGLLSTFEDTVGEVVAAGGGRLVKLIGDGAMFVADSPTDGCRIALAVNTAIDAAGALPPARVGADTGPVLSRYGDYFGDVVNRAARLVALARPATIVVSDDVRRVVDGFTFEQLPARALKGFQAPAVTYRLLGG